MMHITRGQKVNIGLSALSMSLVCLAYHAFMDDTNIVHSACTNATPPGEGVVPEMQEEVDQWEGGVRANRRCSCPFQKLLVPTHLPMVQHKMALLFETGYVRQHLHLG
jgi:hypothetical protein